MVTIITGKIDSGKTAELQAIYDHLRSGDGYLIKKLFEKGEHIGQSIVQLSTGERKLISLKNECLPPCWDEVCTYGPYSFSRSGFVFAADIITRALKEGKEPIYMDEIGPLELRGKGFAGILRHALADRKDVYLAVRESCLKDVIIKFGIHPYRLCRVQNP